jgi:predicted metalloprotease with PDZ domain
MHKLLVPAVALVAAVAVPAVAVAAPVTSQSRLTQNGLGSVRLGMTVDQAQKRTRQTITNNDYTPGDDSCGIATLAPKSLGVNMQTTNLKITVINVSSPGISTRKGIEVGDKVPALKQAYGSKLKSTPDKYTPKAVVYSLAFGQRRMQFYTNPKGVITQLTAGRLPEVNFVEGCS